MKNKPTLISLLKPYTGLIILIVVLTILSNTGNLLIPKIIATAIDTYGLPTFTFGYLSLEFLALAIGVFVLTYLQNIVQIYAAERVARDVRNDLTAKISVQSYAQIEQLTPAKILTNLTSDVDAIKTFVSQAIALLISSIFLIIGAALLLLLTNWRLGLAVLAVIPVIAFTFYYIFSQIRSLFKKQQEAIDWLNSVINESILGSSLIRLVNSQGIEYQKFLVANTEARNIGMGILRLFASLIPIISFCTNIATLTIILLGGHFVIGGSMTLGDFTAFNSYLAILVFPILIIGFSSTIIAQAGASYGRIAEILNAPVVPETGTLKNTLRGDLEVKNINVVFGQKKALKDVSFKTPAGSKTAIIGPTAAGKTQLLYVLTGLLKPTSGEILYDNVPSTEYDKQSIHQQVGFVFQDSVMFNLSIRENIAFSTTVKDADIALAIETAELKDFIDALPDKLETRISERGTSLSGGQKQRVMLARALALNPKMLLLDDFTARVDTRTERKILDNIAKNYPKMTIISVTQKIAAVEHYDQIIVLMEGEILARGTHEQLMSTSPEYVQIFESQKSTNAYELQA